MVVVKSRLNTEQVSLINDAHLHWKMYFGTETSGLNNEGGILFSGNLNKFK